MKKSVILGVFFLAIAGMGIYFNALVDGFVWDDRVLVLENQYIRSFANLPNAFISDLMKFNVLKLNFYRPLQTISYMWDYHFWGLNPFGYHLTSVFLHIACAVLIFLLALFLSQDTLLSFFSALIFMVNPVQTEAVTYISGRADILVTLFVVGSVFMAFLSVGLGFLNLLPIPILDGGLILFSVIELIRGRPLSEKIQTVIGNTVGVLLLGLFIWISWIDLQRIEGVRTAIEWVQSYTQSK